LVPARDAVGPFELERAADDDIDDGIWALLTVRGTDGQLAGWPVNITERVHLAWAGDGLLDLLADTRTGSDVITGQPPGCGLHIDVAARRMGSWTAATIPSLVAEARRRRPGWDVQFWRDRHEQQLELCDGVVRAPGIDAARGAARALTGGRRRVAQAPELGRPGTYPERMRASLLGALEDRSGRALRDLRVSVTDRCNFRCRYCMPREVFGPDFAFLPRDQLLTFEEIARVVRVAAGLGVRKVRLTGGEPLLRRDLRDLVALLAGIEGIDDLAMTTNGSLLATHAVSLRAGGLRRVTVSLDSLDDATFRAVSDVKLPLAQVLEGIAAADAAGFTGIKLNAVVKRGVNDDGIVDLARFGHDHGYTVRFIEYMDVGASNGWRLDDVVPADEIVARIAAELPLEPLEPQYSGEVARRFRFRDGAGELGVIPSVTQPFCGTCTRARLSAVGEVYTCLFATRGRDLRGALRGGADDAEIAALLSGTWRARDDRYSQLRTSATPGAPRVEMSYIGG